MKNLRGDDRRAASLGQALLGGLGRAMRARGSGVEENTGIVPLGKAM